MNIKFLTFIVLLTISARVVGQQNDNSPYSRYGIGLLADKNFNHLRHMGGLGSSFVDGNQINIVNPASYAQMNATAFDIGFFAKYTSLKDQRNTNSFWSGNLEYISLAFPLKNPINEIYDGKKLKHKFGMGLTLKSHSNVDYNIQVKDSITDIGNFDRNYLGSGGTYTLKWGNAYKYKDFSIGVNLNYIFGRIKTERNLIYAPSKFAYNSFNSTSYNVRAFSMDAGILYMKTLNQKEHDANKSIPLKRISFGANITPSSSFDTRAAIENYLVQNLLGGVINADTILYSLDSMGKGRLPIDFGVGATLYSGEKWSLGVNYTGALWSKYFNDATGSKEGSLANAFRASVGGYYRPNYKSVDNFLERIYYRYGAYYGKDPLIVNNKQIDEYAFSFGMTAPVVFQRKVSHMNLGAIFGARGAGTTISERFIKISMSFAFNDDEWFLKRKYN